MTESAPTPGLASEGATTSLWARITNIFVSPGYVFDEVCCSPHRVWNWLVPVGLVVLTSLALLGAATPKDQIAASIRGLVREESLSTFRADTMSRVWNQTSVATLCCTVVFATLWSALVLWSIARFLLKVRFSFSKAIEVVGLSQMVLVLGTVVTFLLIAASGDPSSRPALSFFAGWLPPENPVRVFLDAFNVFHMWMTSVLAVGLSRLTGVSFKEAAFWVFGYWVILRGALILLA